MFLGFGKRNSTPKKNETPQESPKTVSSLGLNLSTEVPNGGSRSTVQTTAGPLLSSTRFNSILDASTYANVNSPGFSSRVVNCASNGNSSYHENSATHQSKYSSVGLFPRVHLCGQSTLSILSPRNSQKVGKTPVRVRIAPPSSNLTRRHSICIGSSEAIKSKSEISKQLVSSHQQSHRKDGSLTPSKTTDSGILADNLQEASRKRIFSECQDSYDESKKRRKKTEIPIPNPNHDVYHYKHVRAPAVPVSVSLPSQDNSSQGKRAREKGSPEEQKRQRRKVCNTNNAIFSSLSSSRNLLERLTAQKRKSIDTSRSSSPLTPLNGKQVKERKPASDATSSHRNLSAAPQQNGKIPCGTSQVGTPITSKVIPRKTDLCTVEKNESEGKSALNNSHPNSACDYTTKLFRKDVSSPVPRTPTSKTPKQSLWVQAPEVDDLSCSLLSDDAKLDRPDRLKSLLARVSGKDKTTADKTSPATNDVSKETSKSSYSGVALPGNTALKALSPSSALTVTVSSTCTIMTSATVTSVNGVPSSESSHPQTLSASVLSTKCSQSSLTTETSKAGDTSSVGVTIVCSAATSSSMPKQGSLFNASGSSNSVTGIADEGFKPSTSFSMKSPISSNTPAVGESKENTSVALPKPTFQFGSNSNNLQTASSSLFKLGSGAETSSAECAPISTSSTSLSQVSKTTTASGSTFQFSSSQSNSALLSESKSSSNLSTLSFGSSGNAQTGSFNSSSQLVVNGTSLSSQSKTPENAGTPKTFSFGSISAVSSETSEGAPQTSTSTNLEVALKPSFQFGPTTNSPALSSFQSGSNSSVSTTSFQFGSGSNGPKAGFGSSTSTSSPAPNSTFQFGSNGTGLASAITPTPQFGSNTTSLSANTKPSFQFGASSPSVNQTVQFGSSNSGSSEASKSAFQFGSSNGVSSGNPKSAFQFGSSSTAEVAKPAVSFGSITNGAVASAAKDTFQFGGSSQNSSSANPAFQFGGSSASSPPSNQFGSIAKSQSSSSPFQFGSTTGKSLDSAKPAFQFSSSSEKPTFGLSIQGSGSAFSQVPQQQPKGTFAFSQSTNSSANTNEAKSTFTFGSSTPAFGSANANNTQFGQGSSSSFGSSSSTQTPQPSFGSAAPKANGFGSTPSFGSAVSNTAAFSFGANNTSGSSTNSGAGGAFSFGQKQETAPSFSFNATVTSIPNQSAQATPAPGLFSVGAGTSTSTRRVVRDARRRR